MKNDDPLYQSDDAAPITSWSVNGDEHHGDHSVELGDQPPEQQNHPVDESGDAELAAPAQDAADRAVDMSVSPSAAMAAETSDGVQYPFKMEPDGVYYAAETRDGEFNWELVCSPLRVLAVTRDAGHGQYGRLLQIEHLDGGWHEWAMPMSLLAGDGVGYREELLRLGLRNAPGHKARHRLHEYLMATTPAARARCVSRAGWNGDVYVLHDGAIGASEDGERVILQTTSGPDPRARSAGTLREWQEEVAAKCLGNSRLTFAMSLSFAAPLLELTGDESGGFHFRGGSSIGKTTALRVAASAYGSGGDGGYLHSWRATSNGLEGIATMHNDGLLCLDELGQVSGREAGEVAYMLGNGTGKRRARGDGSARRAAEWRILFLSTGELSLADKLSEAGLQSRTGQEVRLVEIPADAGAGFGLFENLHGSPDAAAFARHLQSASSQFHGTAIPEFLRQFVHQRENIKGLVSAIRRRWVDEHCPKGADGQVERVADRFGLIATAGELAAHYGILPWPEGEATLAAAACFNAWLDMRGGTGPAEVAKGIEQVRRLIREHGSSRFQRSDTETVRDRLGWVGDDGRGGREFMFLGEAWRDICKGFDWRAITAALVKQGHLRVGSDGKPQISQRLPGFGTKRVYILRSTILGDEDDHADQ